MLKSWVICVSGTTRRQDRAIGRINLTALWSRWGHSVRTQCVLVCVTRTFHVSSNSAFQQSPQQATFDRLQNAAASLCRCCLWLLNNKGHPGHFTFWFHIAGGQILTAGEWWAVFCQLVITVYGSRSPLWRGWSLTISSLSPECWEFSSVQCSLAPPRLHYNARYNLK